MDGDMPATGEQGATQPEPKKAIELDPMELGEREYKAGDTIQLKVVGHTSEGKLQCEAVEPDKNGDFGDDFDKGVMGDEQEPAAATNGGGAEQATGEQ